jgi:hypothetical protein
VDGRAQSHEAAGAVGQNQWVLVCQGHAQAVADQRIAARQLAHAGRQQAVDLCRRGCVGVVLDLIPDDFQRAAEPVRHLPGDRKIDPAARFG